MYEYIDVVKNYMLISNVGINKRNNSSLFNNAYEIIMCNKSAENENFKL